jgi:hypothetical protein
LLLQAKVSMRSVRNAAPGERRKWLQSIGGRMRRTRRCWQSSMRQGALQKADGNGGRSARLAGLPRKLQALRCGLSCSLISHPLGALFVCKGTFWLASLLVEFVPGEAGGTQGSQGLEEGCRP